jgi:hypothetical protein
LAFSLWRSGNFDGPEQASLPEVMTLIEDGRVKAITVTGDRLEITKSNDEVITTYKPTGDR